MKFERTFIALVAAGTASPIALHALWRPLGTAAGVFAAVPAPLLTMVAVLIPLVSAVVFAAFAHHPARARVTQGAALFLAGASAIAIGAPRGALLPLVLPLAAVFALSGFGLPWVARRLPASLDSVARRRRAAAGLWAVLGLVTMLQAARLSTFMADPSMPSASLLPKSAFFVRHACLGSYLYGAELSRRGVENVYQEPLEAKGQLASDARPIIDLGPFMPEGYEYPPPFLLLPRLALLFTHDLFILRAVWFAVQAGLLAFALFRLARWIGGKEGERVALLAPLAWISIPSLLGMQLGNFQVSVTALSILAMIAFEERRPATGGALLAFCVLSKLWPGMLVIYLLAQRRLRDVAWILGFSVVYILASLVVLGPGPFAAFVSEQLPRIASGEAFSFMTKTTAAMVMNYSVFGIPLKLKALGVPGMSLSVSVALTWLYTLLVVGLAVIAALRIEDRRLRACAWLALMSLGALRAPFAPGHAIVSTQWLMTLLAAEVCGRRAVAFLVAGWIVVSALIPPLSPLSPVALPLSMVSQGAGFALLFWCILRKPRRIDAACPAEPSQRAQEQPSM